MLKKLTREELIVLVNKIIECEGSEDEVDKMLEVLRSNVPHPEVSDLIYWNEEELTAEQIVDEALAYRTIQI